MGRARAAGFAVDRSATWVVGDTLRDLACARAGGVRCLLVATGSSSVTDLEGAGADAVLADLGDTERMVALVTS